MPKGKSLVEKINENVAGINLGFVSMFVYKNGSNTICIDTGVNTRDVEEAFNELKIDPGSVNAVLLTHSDRDHTGGLKLFANAKVLMSEEEEQMINGTTARFLKLIHNKKPECTLIFKKDGDEFNLGDISVKCIGTPGHTPGSMSYLINGKYLFAGDILNFKNGKAVMDRSFLQMDKKLQEESIRKLARLQGIELLFTAHTGFTGDFKKAMENWI